MSITKVALVELDSRFDDWLVDRDGREGYEENKDKRFLVVSETRDAEITINGYDDLAGVKKAIEDAIEDAMSGSCWSVEAVFDISNMKEIPFKIKHVVEVG